MIEINSEIILLNALIGKKYITISKIKKISNKIMSLNPDIYVDVSMSNLLSTVEIYRDFFFWNAGEDKIRAVPWKGKDKLLTRKYVDQMFNWKLPKDRITDIVNICRK